MFTNRLLLKLKEIVETSFDIIERPPNYKHFKNIIKFHDHFYYYYYSFTAEKIRILKLFRTGCV